MKKETTNDDKIIRLYRLDELDKYEVADKDTDVRGYTLLGGDGERLGKIDELIVDPEIGKVRYLDIKLDTDLVVVDDNRHILLPIGVATLDEEHDNIVVRSLNRSNVKFIPPYKGQPLTREYEQSLRDSHRYTMLNNDITVKKPTKEASESENFRDEGFSYMKSRTSSEGYSQTEEYDEANDKENLSARVQVLKKERDIARAERDILKVQLERARKGIKDDFYEHEDFDDSKFYEARKRRDDK